MQIISKELIKQVIDDALGFIRVNFRQIAVLCLPLLLFTTTVGYALAQKYQSTLNALFVPFLFNLLIYPIYTAALIQLMTRKARHEQPANAELLLVALRQWGPLFVLKAVTVVLIVAGSVLILPGIWLWVRLSFAEFYLVVFGMTPKEALQRSMAATRPYFALLLLLLIITYIPIMLSNLMVDQLVFTLARQALPGIIINTLWSFFGLFVVVVLFRVFMEALNRET